jgi:hypothetical protein
MVIVISQLALTEWDIPPEVDEALHNAKEAQTSVTALQERSDSLHQDITDHCTTLRPLVDDLTPLIHHIEELNKYKQYLTCVAHIENIRYLRNDSNF